MAIFSDWDEEEIDRDSLYEWIKSRLDTGTRQDLYGTLIEGGGDLLSSFAWGAPYKGRPVNRIGSQTAEREMEDLFKWLALKRNAHREDLDERKVRNWERKLDQEDERIHSSKEGLTQEDINTYLSMGTSLEDFLPGQTMKGLGLTREEAKQLERAARMKFQGLSPNPPKGLHFDYSKETEAEALSDQEGPPSPERDAFEENGYEEPTSYYPGGPLGILGKFIEEQKYGTAPWNAKKEGEKPEKSPKMTEGERKERRQFRGWKEPTAPEPGSPLPAEAPKTEQDWRKGLHLLEQQAGHAIKAADLISLSGKDLPGAGFEQWLAGNAGKIGGGAGALLGGAAAGLTTGGWGTVAGVAAGGAGGTAAGEILGGLGQKFVSDEGLKLQRELQGVANPQLYERSGAQINEQEMERLMRELGINYKDPNADRLIRDSMPGVLDQMIGKAELLIASNRQMAEYLARQGSGPVPILQKLREARARFDKGWENRTSSTVNGPDGQRYNIIPRGNTGGYSGRY